MAGSCLRTSLLQLIRKLPTITKDKNVQTKQMSAIYGALHLESAYLNSEDTTVFPI
jgi:hypothetical protein